MIHLLVGVQGSGKTTFSKILAKERNCKIISTDEIRKTNPGILETNVWSKTYECLAETLKKGEDAIFDATSISKKVRKRFFDEVSKYGVEVKAIAYYLKTDVNECASRVKKRNEDKNELYLPPEVVYSYFEKLEVPSLDEGFLEIKTVINNEII